MAPVGMFTSVLRMHDSWIEIQIIVNLANHFQSREPLVVVWGKTRARNSLWIFSQPTWRKQRTAIHSFFAGSLFPSISSHESAPKYTWHVPYKLKSCVYLVSVDICGLYLDSQHGFPLRQFQKWHRNVAEKPQHSAKRDRMTLTVPFGGYEKTITPKKGIDRWPHSPD